MKSSPNSFEVNELLGLVYAAQGKQSEANRFLARAVQLKPNVVEARTTLATNLLALHRADAAEIQFKKAVQIEPQNYDANHNLGEFYIQIRKISSAIPFLKRAQEVDPAAYNNGYDLALAFEQTGQFDEARQQLGKLITLRDSAELHSLLGEVEEKSRNYLSSAAQYEQAARMEPNEQNIFAWGTELLLHQTFVPAEEVFRAGLNKFPGSVRLQLGLGIALYGDGKYDEAAGTFLKAADRDVTNPLPIEFAGKAYENLSPAIADKVLSRLKAATEGSVSSPALRYYYALALWKLNEKEPRSELRETIESLLKATIATDPAYTDAYLQLGILYANETRYKEAISKYEMALKLNADLPNVHYRLGQALMRLGDSARAQTEFATFERLREKQAQETDKQGAEVKQFVYTMRDSSREGSQETIDKSAKQIPR